MHKGNKTTRVEEIIAQNEKAKEMNRDILKHMRVTNSMKKSTHIFIYGVEWIFTHIYTRQLGKLQ